MYEKVRPDGSGGVLLSVVWDEVGVASGGIAEPSIM